MNDQTLGIAIAAGAALWILTLRLAYSDGLKVGRLNGLAEADKARRIPGFGRGEPADKPLPFRKPPLDPFVPPVTESVIAKAAPGVRIGKSLFAFENENGRTTQA